MNRSLVVSVLLLSACAEELEPRVLVQADAIAKSDLEGEWNFRQTVVGAPYSTGFTFIGEQGENEMDRIVWDIQEHMLVARRATEHVRGSEKDQPSQQTSGRYMGAPVAGFRITSHFDIVRDYNPSTGEEYDRVVENTERKWYERRFIRVDWSQNLVTSFDFLVDWWRNGVENIRQDPVPYYVSDPNDPDHLRLERPSQDAPASYLEITQKLVVQPEAIDFEDWANVPLCWLEYATNDCASQEIKVRLSFHRAGKRDYEPWRYDDRHMERFGFFTTQRTTYNRQYGQTEEGRLRFVNRFNQWRRSMTDVPCTDDAACGDPAPGRRCVKEIVDATLDDDGKVVGRCSLPYSVRNLENPDDPSSRDLGPNPIVYYLNDTFPEDLEDAAQRVADDYDEVFTEIVEKASGREQTKRAFILCRNNPVKAGDPDECGPPGTHARIGDLRFNMLYWVDNPTSVGLLGYGPGSHDPDTGETLQAYAFVYGAEIDRYAAQARDVVRLVNGEIRPDRFIDGVNVRQWVAETGAGPRHRTFTREDLRKAGDAMKLDWTKGLPKTPTRRKASARKMAEMRRERGAALARSQVLGADPGVTTRRLSRLQNTDLERRLTSGDVLFAGGLDPLSAPHALSPEAARPFELMRPGRVRSVHRHRAGLGAHAVDLAPSFDDAILGFATSQKGKDPQVVWRAIREMVFRSTAAHELGHSLGLRHNFAGTNDAMNYPKTYWDLRTANGTKAPKPRWEEPPSEQELLGVELANGLRAGISEFETSSVMDYASRFNSDVHGLGRYDRAALKFGYAGLVEVFDDVKDRYLIGGLQALSTFGYPEPILIDCDAEDYIGLSYTKLPSLVDLDRRSDVHLSEISRRLLTGTGCEFPDEVDMDTEGRIVVPYKFCSDEFESASPDCWVYDRGADMYEIAHNAVESYRSYYLFDAFRRDQLDFEPDWYLDRIYWRYLEPLRSQMQFYVLFRSDYEAELPDEGPDSFWRHPEGWGGYTAAVQLGFDLIGEILTTPEPGFYNLYELEDGREGFLLDWWDDEARIELELPRARYQETGWEYDSGYYWSDRVHHVGAFLDKVAALYVLTDPETGFLGRDDGADLRQYAINYWRVYPEQMQRFIGALMTDRWDLYAPLWDWEKWELVDRPLSQPRAPTVDESPIDPATGFGVKLWTATLAQALVPATFDQSYTDAARIWLEGTGAAIDSERDTVELVDPYSGKIYKALSFDDGDGEKGIGAQILLRANELLAQDQSDYYVRLATQSHLEIVEIARTVSQYYVDEPR